MDTSKLWMLLLIPTAIAVGLWVTDRVTKDLRNRLAVRAGARKARRAERERIARARNKYFIPAVIDYIFNKIAKVIMLFALVVGVSLALFGWFSGSHSLMLVGVMGGLAIIATGWWLYISINR